MINGVREKRVVLEERKITLLLISITIRCKAQAISKTFSVSVYRNSESEYQKLFNELKMVLVNINLKKKKSKLIELKTNFEVLNYIKT